MNFKKIIKNPFFWAFIVGIASLHFIREMSIWRKGAPPPMVYVDNWTLVDHEGRKIAKSDLMGKIIIADFFFTSCPSICPKLTQAMKDVYKRFVNKQDKIVFLSITVDPQKDSPEVLKDFLSKNNLTYPNWFALTGEPKDIYETVVEKMKVHMGERQEIAAAPGVYDIPHLAHLALFDKNGDLRGLFKTNNQDLAALSMAANFLIEN